MDVLLRLFDTFKASKLHGAVSEALKKYLYDQADVQMRTYLQTLKFLSPLSDYLNNEEHRSFDTDWQTLVFDLFQIDTHLFDCGFVTNWAVRITAVLKTKWKLNQSGLQDPRKIQSQPEYPTFDRTRRVVLDLEPFEKGLLCRWYSVCSKEGFGEVPRAQAQAMQNQVAQAKNGLHESVSHQASRQGHASSSADVEYAAERSMSIAKTQESVGARPATSTEKHATTNAKLLGALEVEARDMDGGTFENASSDQARMLEEQVGAADHADAQDGELGDEVDAAFDEGVLGNVPKEVMPLFPSPPPQPPSAPAPILSPERQTYTVGRRGAEAGKGSINAYGTSINAYGTGTMSVGMHKGYKVRGRKHQDSSARAVKAGRQF